MLLIALQCGLAWLSRCFAYDAALLTKPVLVVVGLLLLLGVVYLLALRGLRKLPAEAAIQRLLAFWILAAGVAMRAVLLFSTPVLEDDFYRYLWDGAVTASGENPFAYTPDEVVMADETPSLPPKLRQLAGPGEETLWRINHSDLRTIYPPVAQVAFALAYWIAPWQLWAWRLVLFGFDLATLGLLALFFRRWQLPLAGLAVYWWNPLVVMQSCNAAHMDAVVLPFVLGALWLAISGRQVWAAGALGLAVGAKVWPVLLLPVLLRSLLARPRRLAGALAVFAAICAALFWPVYRAGLNQSSGFTAYSQSWEMNDALFMALLWPFKQLGKWQGWEPRTAQLTVRFITALLLAGLLVWLIRRAAMSEIELAERCLWLVAALFLLSPAQFPWYGLWFVPLLALRPRWSLLWLTALLPLYYLRFYFSARGQVTVFDHGIVWVEYVPVWLLLAREWYRVRRGHTAVLWEARA